MNECSDRVESALVAVGFSESVSAPFERDELAVWDVFVQADLILVGYGRIIASRDDRHRCVLGYVRESETLTWESWCDEDEFIEQLVLEESDHRAEAVSDEDRMLVCSERSDRLAQIGASLCERCLAVGFSVA